VDRRDQFGTRADAASTNHRITMAATCRLARLLFEEETDGPLDPALTGLGGSGGVDVVHVIPLKAVL